MALLDEYIVGVSGAWDGETAAHLMRRAGFGGTLGERQAAVGAGDQNAMRAAVDSLVDIAPIDPWLDVAQGIVNPTFGDPIPDLPDSAPLTDPVGLILSQIKNPISLPQLQGQWLYRMRHTSQPLQEQLTLFMHDHMVSELDKIAERIPDQVNLGNDGSQLFQICNSGTLPLDLFRSARMAGQLVSDQMNLFRQTGIDSFRDLLINITRDPCMLVYLDNVVNIKDAPQENYAREVMELFSMGVGNYSENDIREIAKCLTGETLFYWLQGIVVACENDYSTDYGFLASQHTPGTKTVFGETVQESFTGQETVDVIDLILERVSSQPNAAALDAPYQDLPATALYMSWKLLTWFLDHDFKLLPTPDPIVVELADYMRGTDNGAYPQRRYPYDMRACLRKLFLSSFFYDSNFRQQMHKNPTEFVVSALKGLEIDDLYTTNAGPPVYLDFMGMRLFNPPNVAGWNHGRNWSSSGNVIARSYYAYHIAYETLNAFASEYGKAVLDSWLAANGGTIANFDDDAGIADYVAERLLHGTITTEERDSLLQALGDIFDLEPAPLLAEPRYYLKAMAAIYMVLTMPRFQLK